MKLVLPSSPQCCIPYRNQSFDLHRKSNDWFLYEIEHWTEMGNCVCVFILRPSLFPYGGAERGVQALNATLTKLILHIGCPSYRLTSGRKSALIQRLSVQIPKAFHYHTKVEKTQISA